MKKLVAISAILLAGCLSHKDIAQSNADMAEYIQEQNRIQSQEILLARILKVPYVQILSEEVVGNNTFYTCRIRYVDLRDGQPKDENYKLIFDNRILTITGAARVQ